MPPNTNFLTTTNPSPAVAGTTRTSITALLLACMFFGCNGSDDGAAGAAGAAGMTAATGGTGGEPLPTGGTGDEGGAGGAGGAAGLDVLPNGCTGNCWSYMGYGPGSDYHNTAETVLSVDNVAMLQPIWTADVGGSATGAAAVVGDTVYFASQGKLVALDRANGELRWGQPIGASGSVSYADGKVFIQSFQGSVYRFDAATGTKDWSAKIAGVASVGTPLVLADRIIVGTSSGDEVITENSVFRGSALALDRATGTTLWQHYTVELPSNGAAIWSSPSVDLEMGAAFFTTGNNYGGPASGQSDSIFALDLETGEVLWTYQALADDVWSLFGGTGPDHDFGANPILFEADGKPMVGAGSKSGTFYALDRNTGEEVWTREVAASTCQYAGILNNGAYDGQRIYVSSWPCFGDATLAALDPATGEVVWQVATDDQSWSPLTVAHGVLFAPSQTIMNAYDASDGTLLFSYEAGGSIASAAVVVDGQVFFGSGVPPAQIGAGGAVDGRILHALGLP